MPFESFLIKKLLCDNENRDSLEKVIKYINDFTLNILSDRFGNFKSLATRLGFKVSDSLIKDLKTYKRVVPISFLKKYREELANDHDLPFIDQILKLYKTYKLDV
jgi:hypothetical protein